MSDPLARCVIDANVALKLFFDQPGSEQADALFAHLDSTPQAQFFVPDFFFAECASALVTYTRQTDYSMQEALQDMEDLLALSFRCIPTSELALPALEIALDTHISGYDAFYIALSSLVNAPLVTADEKLLHALHGKPYQLLSLLSLQDRLPPPARRASTT